MCVVCGCACECVQCVGFVCVCDSWVFFNSILLLVFFVGFFYCMYVYAWGWCVCVCVCVRACVCECVCLCRLYDCVCLCVGCVV